MRDSFIDNNRRPVFVASEWRLECLRDKESQIGMSTTTKDRELYPRWRGGFSTFTVRPSAFSLQPSAFSLQPSAFSLQPRNYFRSTRGGVGMDSRSKRMACSASAIAVGEVRRMV